MRCELCSTGSTRRSSRTWRDTQIASVAAGTRARHSDSREAIPMRAIVVTDEAAGTAGMTLAERPEPSAAINDVIVEIHASGFVPTEMAWPSTWTDRRDRD